VVIPSRVGAEAVLTQVGFLETCSSVRRGEGGGEWLGGPCSLRLAWVRSTSCAAALARRI